MLWVTPPVDQGSSPPLLKHSSRETEIKYCPQSMRAPTTSNINLKRGVPSKIKVLLNSKDHGGGGVDGGRVIAFTWRWCCCERRCPSLHKLLWPTQLWAWPRTWRCIHQRRPGSSTPRARTCPGRHPCTWASPSRCRPADERAGRLHPDGRGRSAGPSVRTW